MKVLNVIVSLDPVNGGGAVERTFQMSRFLVQAGIKCSVLTTDLGLTPGRIKAMEGVNIIALPCLNKRFYIPKFSYNKIKTVTEVADIIHIMNHWTLQNALVYFLARRLNKPYVVCAAGALPIYGRSKILKRMYNVIVGKKIINNAAACIAITADEVFHFQSYGVDIDKITIIPNGINRDNLMIKDDVNFRKKFGLNKNPIILFVGRLNHIKGPDLLLQAFCNAKKDLHDHQLVFAGSDEGMLFQLKKIAANYGMKDRVHFLGYLGGIDKSQAYHAADLLVIPSRQEAMSIVVLEAGITGTPILLTDQCGFNEVTAINGGKVVSASVNGLQEGLIEMLGDSVKMKSMGMNLEKFVSQRFMWDSLINEYIKLYNQILDNKKIV